MNYADINVRVDPDLMRSAERLYEDLGLSVSTAINIFLKASINCGGLPFELKRDIPNNDTIEALSEYAEMIEHPEKYKSYATIEEAVKDVLESA